jgi:glucose-6-phosphate isomerase, archaeal
MLLPEGVYIDSTTGAVTPETGRYVKRLSELSTLFQDTVAASALVAEAGDPKLYEVVEYRKENSDIFFGTTIMESGNIAGEYYMTRGHFHARRDMGEVYYTQSGQGILLLDSRDGQQSVTVEMKPGVCAFIPPDWAHRSINTGSDQLIFVWVCNPAAGHDYADILTKGMRKRVMQSSDGGVQVVDNPTAQ